MLMASQFKVGIPWKIAEIDAGSFVINPIALQSFPPDAPLNHIPVCVRGDGNCLFHAASLLLTGYKKFSQIFMSPDGKGTGAIQ